MSADQLALDARKAAEVEASAWRDYAEADAKHARGGSLALAAAYADGKIDGKNAEIRKSQEAEYFASDESLRELTKAKREARYRAEVAKAERIYRERLFNVALDTIGRSQEPINGR